MSKMKCPVCHGTGKITENNDEYLFETRSPQTDTCLICNGTGLIGPRKVLPDGQKVYELAKQQDEKGTTKATKSTKKDCDAAGRPFISGGEYRYERSLIDGDPVTAPDLEAAKDRLEELVEALKPEEITVHMMIITVRGTSKACAELTANVAKLISE